VTAVTATVKIAVLARQVVGCCQQAAGFVFPRLAGVLMDH
jgi:hypothetical protein